MRHHAWITLLSALLVFSLLSSCAVLQPHMRSAKMDGATLEGKQVDLSRVAAIIPLYELVTSSSIPQDRSQLAFVFRDGTYSLQTNHYMFQKQAAWTQEGVFYSDRKYDYFIDGHSHTIHVTPHEKTDFEYITYSLDNSHTLTMYNTGMGIKNNGILSITSPRSSYRDYTYTLGYESIMGNNVAVCKNGNSYEVGNDGDISDPQLVLYQLSKNFQPTYQKIHSIDAIQAHDISDAPDVLENVQNSPRIDIHGISHPTTVCHDNWIYSVVFIGKKGTSSYTENPHGYALAIMRWNIESGEHAFTVIRHPDRSVLYSPHGDQWNGVASATQSLQGDSFILMSYDSGSIISVDMNTGIYTEVSSPLRPQNMWPIGKVYLHCTPNFIYQTWIPVNDTLGTHSGIDVYSRTTYKHISHMSIDDSFTRYEQTETLQPGYVSLNPNLP